MDVKQLGAYMREKRLSEKKSIRQVGRFIGLDFAVISRFERGLRTPNKKSLVKICSYLNIDIETVVEQPVQFKVQGEKEPHTVVCDRCLARKKIWI